MLGIGLVAGVGDALVERHHDVRTEVLLDGNGPGRIEIDLLAADFVAEEYAVFSDSFLRQGKYLETTRIGQDRPFPGHEAVQAAGFFYEAFSWLEMQMVGVAENDLGSGFMDLGRSKGFHGAVSRHRHENRCRDFAAGGGNDAETGGGFPVPMKNRKIHVLYPFAKETARLSR